MDNTQILNSFDYDFDDLSFNIDMSNKLFCTFTAREELDTL